MTQPQVALNENVQRAISVMQGSSTAQQNGDSRRINNRDIENGAYFAYHELVKTSHPVAVHAPANRLNR